MISTDRLPFKSLIGFLKRASRLILKIYVKMIFFISTFTSLLVFELAAASLPLSDGSFELRASIKHIQGQEDDLESARVVRTFERFSDVTKMRSIVEVGLTTESSETKRESFHYGGRTNTWLRISDPGLCVQSSESELHDLIFGKDLAQLLTQQVFGRQQSTHLIGISKVLLHIQKNRDNFKCLKQKSLTKLSDFRLKQYELKDGSRLTILVTYYDSNRGLSMPTKVELTINDQAPFSRFTIQIENFKDFGWLSQGLSLDLEVPGAQSKEFLYPLGVGCSSYLVETNASSTYRAIYQASHHISFKAYMRDVSRSGSNRRFSNLSKCRKLAISLDKRTSLLRRDESFVSERTSNISILRSVYDFKSNLEHSNLQSGSQVTACLSSSIFKDDENMDFMRSNRFVSDRAAVMGSTEVGARRVVVVEEEFPEGAPFWLIPKARSNLKKPIEPVSLVYYLSEAEPFKPIQILLIPKLAASSHKLLELHEFDLDRSSFENPFNLAAFCHRISHKPKHVSMLLEKKLNSKERKRLLAADFRWIRNPIKRFDAFEMSLASSFGFRPTCVQVHSTSLLHRSRSKTFGIGLDFTLSKFDLCRRDLDYVQAEDQASLISLCVLDKFNRTTIDECARLANHIGSERQMTTFAYSSDLGQCLVCSDTQPCSAVNSFTSDLTSFKLNRLRSGPAGRNSGQPSECGSLDHIINRSLTLTINEGSSTSKQLSLVVKNMRIRDDIATRESGNYFKGIGWVQGAAGKLVWLPGETSASGSSRDLYNQLSESTCRSFCLTDSSCNSYSFCSRSRFNQAECLLSSIDLKRTHALADLNNTDAKLNYLRDSTLVKYRKGCTIANKQYLDQFRKISNSRLDQVHSRGLMIAEVDKERCATLCYQHNMRHFELDPMDQIKLHIERLAEVDYEDITLELVRSINDEWRRARTHGMCTHFQHLTVQMESTNKTTEACLLDLPKLDSAQPEPSPSSPADLYRLAYLNLYRASYGLRLTSSSEYIDDAEDPHGALIRLRELIASHNFGINYQVQLATDSLEQCAQLCTLQSQGPYPLCSSFDFVHETFEGGDLRYCQLNSQTYKDLQRLGRAFEQTEFLNGADENIQFWHYEPNEMLKAHRNIEPRLINEQFIRQLDKLISYQTTRSLWLPSAFTCISTSIVILGFISGIITAVKIVNFCQRPRADQGNVMRQIHRLSGVGLRCYLKEGEVLM